MENGVNNISNEERIKVNEILEDFKSRQADKKRLEEAWLLNINFLVGNQNVYLGSNGEILEKERLYPYESREVFNHIAPIVESRLAKLNKVRPKIAVRASGASESDKETAKLTKMVLDSEFENLNMVALLKDASVWSEVVGTVIYKLTYGDEGLGVSVVSPFEIFPENPSLSRLEDNPSIIHARAIDREQAESVYGLKGLVGSDIKSLSLDSLVGVKSGLGFCSKSAEVVVSDQVLVVERYVRPSEELVDGWLQIVVGDRLVYDGVMPLSEYPFVKQVSNEVLGSFWGASVIERCIPVQRAYNAVKNRKLEFLSRLSSGVLAVEEGSVDLDSLEDEGLAPGKILVYRSGANMPRFMDGFVVPSELNREEERLLGELNTLAGVSDLMRNSIVPSNVTSGTAINQLTEADDSRISVTAENVRESLLKLAKLALRVIKKEVKEEKLSKLFDEKGSATLFYWKGSDLKADDIVLDTANELADSISSRRQMALELFRAGLFSGEDGRLDPYSKSKILDILGFGSFEAGQDIASAHIERAKRENLNPENIYVLEVDDHLIHIQEHTRAIVESDEAGVDYIDRLISHIREHNTFRSLHENGAGVK